MFKDIHNQIEVRTAIPVTRQTNSSTAIVSSIIDMSAYDVCEFVIATGNLTDADATFAVTLDEGNVSNLSDAAAVAAIDRLGTLPALTFASDNTVAKVGYKGSKRYVRLTFTPTNNDAGNCDVSCVAVLFGAAKQPTP